MFIHIVQLKYMVVDKEFCRQKIEDEEYEHYAKKC